MEGVRERVVGRGREKDEGRSRRVLGGRGGMQVGRERVRKKKGRGEREGIGWEGGR